MLHYPMDSMIRVPLEISNRYLGGSLPIEIDRDKADSNRITILRTVVNIARIMITISDIIPNMIIPLGKRQKLGHSYIMFLLNIVER
jgi:hypothetical protein